MGDYWSQDNAIVAAADPVAAGATGTSTSDAIDMSKFGRVSFVVYAGVQTTTGNASLVVQEGTSSSTFNTSTALTTVDFGANKDNAQWIVEVHDTALTAGYRYLRGLVKQETATGYVGCVAIADLARYGPASDDDVASVTSITVKA